MILSSGYRQPLTGPEGLAAKARPLIPYTIIPITAVYLFFAGLFPLAIRDLGIDDGLFVRNAMHLVQGHWLGNYDWLTLSKGPGFPMFLAITHLAGVPVTFALAATHALACLVLWWSLQLVGFSAYCRAVVYLIALYDPIGFPYFILREMLYASLSVLLVGLTVAIVFDTKVWRGYLNAGLCGITFAWFWITREEGVFIVPGLMFIITARIWQFSKNANFWSCLLLLTKRLLLGVFCAIVVLTTVAFINKAHYGLFLITDMKAPEFKNALAAIQSVSDGHNEPFIPVPARMRSLIYHESPSFKQLENWMEGENNIWRSSSSGFFERINKAPSSCYESEFFGGWFLWAFRLSVLNAGHYKDGESTEKYYSKLAKEIETAQKEGRLPGAPSDRSFAPRIRTGNLQYLPWSLVRLIEAVLFRQYQRGDELTMGSSGGIKIPEYAAFVGLEKTYLYQYTNIDVIRHCIAAELAGISLGVYKALRGFYCLLQPVVFGLGGLSFTALCLLALHKNNVACGKIVVISFLASVVASRVIILIVIDITSFPAYQERYFGASHIMLGAASILSLCELLRVTYWNIKAQRE